MNSRSGRVRIRRAAAADLAFVHRDKEIPGRAMRRMVREGDVFVALADGRRVGMARLEHLWGKTPFLTSLWVEPRFRRRGVAAALLDHVARTLRRRGRTMLLSSTMPDNPAGKVWHRVAGFRRCGFIRDVNPGGVGEVFYQLDLSGRRGRHG